MPWSCENSPQGSASSVRGDFAFSVNGGREDANAYLLDGVYNMDPKLGTAGVRPPVDAIYEFGVATSAFQLVLTVAAEMPPRPTRAPHQSA